MLTAEETTKVKNTINYLYRNKNSYILLYKDEISLIEELLSEEMFEKVFSDCIISLKAVKIFHKNTEKMLICSLETLLENNKYLKVERYL